MWIPYKDMFSENAEPKNSFNYDRNCHGKINGRERTFVSKGWGWEDWIWNNDEYCGKLLFVKQGRQCSWHYHKLKDETFYLQSGELDIITDWTDEMPAEFYETLRPGESFHIPRMLRHRFRARQDSYLFEFSTQHFDSDSYRVIAGD